MCVPVGLSYEYRVHGITYHGFSPRVSRDYKKSRTNRSKAVTMAQPKAQQQFEPIGHQVPSSSVVEVPWNSLLFLWLATRNLLLGPHLLKNELLGNPDMIIWFFSCKIVTKKPSLEKWEATYRRSIRQVKI